MDLHAFILTLLFSQLYREILPLVESYSSCHWSRITAEIVTSCPANKQKMRERAQFKKCEQIAREQNCTERHNFKYHCVMDEQEKAYFEVCAVESIIHDYCAEYNTGGAVVQPNYNLKCSEVNPQCISRWYISTDAYLNKGCYNIVKTQKPVSSTSVIPDSTTENIDNKQNLEDDAEYYEKVIIIIIVLMLTILIVGISLFVLCRKRFGRCVKKEKHKKEDKQGEKNADASLLREKNPYTPKETTV